jgi:hypothetical protein
VTASPPEKFKYGIKLEQGKIQQCKERTYTIIYLYAVNIATGYQITQTNITKSGTTDNKAYAIYIHT